MYSELSPWFNFVCQRAMVKMKYLEDYRKTRAVMAFQKRWIQSDIQHHIFQMAYTDYRSIAISSCLDSTTLWHKMNVLLDLANASTGPYPVDDVTAYITGKVEAFHAITVEAPLPMIWPKLVLPLDRFEFVILRKWPRPFRVCYTSNATWIQYRRGWSRSVAIFLVRP